MLPRVIGSLRSALLLFSFFYFDTGAYEFVDLEWDKEVMALAKLSVHVIAWISVPNESYDFKKQLAVCTEGWVTCLQKSKRRASHSRVF
jgi:hypothetical protein